MRGGKWEPLGRDLASALMAYARIFEAPKGGMADLIDAYMTHAAPRRESSRRQYRSVAGRLKKIFKNFAPEQVTMREVAKMKLGLAATPSTANQCLAVLRQVFNYALEAQLVATNPVVGVKRLAERGRDRLISPQEFAAIHDKSGPRLRLVMDLLYMTGQRVGDVLGIRRADLLEEGVAFRQQKTGNRLVVRWTPELRTAVASLLLQARGMRYQAIWADWREACAAAGIEDTQLRDVRAMAATAVGKGNATGLLGHSDARTTDIYLRGREAPVVDGPNLSGGKAVNA